MRVDELQPGDTIDGLIIYAPVKPRIGCKNTQIEVPLLMPLEIELNDEIYLPLFRAMYKEVEGKFYPLIHPYTFDKDEELDETRYKVKKNVYKI